MLLTNPPSHMSRAQCRVEVTFRSMSLNDNVTDSGAPVTPGSTQPEWASRAFRPLEASSVYWHPRLTHSHSAAHRPPHPIPILSWWPYQPVAPAHRAPRAARQPPNNHPVSPQPQSSLLQNQFCILYLQEFLNSKNKLQFVTDLVLSTGKFK